MKMEWGYLWEDTLPETAVGTLASLLTWCLNETLSPLQ